MKTFLTVVGGFLVLSGVTWFLQGANILTAGRSPMIGDPRWEYYGAGAAVLGALLIVVARRRAR